MRRHLSANTIIMALALLISAVLIAGFAAVLATTQVGSTLSETDQADGQGCDSSGDAESAGDCIQSVVDAFAQGETIEPGTRYTSHVTIDPTLQGKELIIGVQYRDEKADGSFGKWWTHKTLRWAASETNASHQRDITACAPANTGAHEMRMVMVAPASASKVPSEQSAVAHSQSDIPVPSTLYRVSTIALAQTQVQPCENIAEDEENVEFFNMQNFNEGYTVSVAKTETAYTLTLECPEQVGTIGSDLRVLISTVDSLQHAECNNSTTSAAPITIPLATAGDLAWCSRGLTCEFEFFAESKSTGTIYSTTLMEIDLPAVAVGNAMQVIPQLQPATLPICADPLSGLNGPTPPAGKFGVLSLCESSSACSTPPPTGYSINQNVYFQTQIKDRVS